VAGGGPLGEEPPALVSCFGPDDCYGAARTLLHLIGTSPAPGPASGPGLEADE
jgi:hypothetical protein